MKIPRDCNGTQLARAMRKLGYEISRQSGSHLMMTSQRGGEHHGTVPNHRPIKVGTLHEIPKSVAAHHGIQVEELIHELGI
jgi:predicted RNA binding protein YcfA (HicA-like mRNA interferase family)